MSTEQLPFQGSTLPTGYPSNGGPRSEKWVPCRHCCTIPIAPGPRLLLKESVASEITKGIEVAVRVAYIAQQSDPARDRYVFAYHITIDNQSERSVQLLDRHWVITEQDGSVREMEGEGVVGEQPVLEPGEEHEYNSGAILGCPDGSMQGSYGMIGEDGETFRITIPRFELNMPRTLH